MISISLALSLKRQLLFSHELTTIVGDVLFVIKSAFNLNFRGL